ncbi:MAG: SUMF1/EgtB/PvdO family nonheme iron enzyme [Rhodomicrobium sp.]
MRYLLLALALCFFWSGGDLSAKPRLAALVVGVDTYNDVVNPDKFGFEQKLNLDKPDKDARAIAETLEKDYGYSVSLLADPGGDTSRPAILAKWTELLESSQDGDVVLFYFAGHGAELKGNNYMLPRDAKYHWKWEDQERLNKLTSSTIELQSLIENLSTAKENSNKDLIGIFIIDACRENPFNFTSDKTGQLVVALGPNVSPSRQLFIMFSAGAGQTAKEAKNAQHSVYAEEFLRLLKEKDMALSEMAQRLRFNVNQAALRLRCGQLPCGPQTPAYYDQLMTRLTISGMDARAEPAHNDAIRAGTPEAVAAERSLGHRDAQIDCPYCPELVVLNAGSFQMGSDGKEKGHRTNEEPRHSVVIGKKFAIGKYQVTNREWDACVREGGCQGARRDDLKPVAEVSWSDANSYLQWLKHKTGATYRLATEAEWEYAARAGTGTRYFFKGDEAQLCEYANGADKRLGVLPYANQTCDDGVGRQTSIVGRYRPNPWGLYDMAGNVWEWVQDCWHENYEGAPADGSSWQEATCARRVARGGSWRSGPDALRSAARNAFPPSHSRSTLGFRVVREIAE